MQCFPCKSFVCMCGCVVWPVQSRVPGKEFLLFAFAIVQVTWGRHEVLCRSKTLRRLQLHFCRGKLNSIRQEYRFKVNQISHNLNIPLFPWPHCIALISSHFNKSNLCKIHSQRDKERHSAGQTETDISCNQNRLYTSIYMQLNHSSPSSTW